jgi:hypothetical protein
MRVNKSDFEKKKKVVIMNYIMELPGFGIHKKRRNVAIQKTSQEHAKLLKKTSPAAIKEMPMETRIEKKTHFTEHTIRSQHEKEELEEGNFCSSVCPTIRFLRNHS